MIASALLCGPGASRRAFLGSMAAAAGAAILPFVTVRAQVSAPVRIEEWGGRARPGLDNTAALRRALAEAARRGADVLLGPGRYEFSASELLRSGAIRRPSGVALEGAGADQTEVRVVGSSVINQLFNADGSSRVATRHIRFVGNGVKDESAPYAGALMSAVLTADAATGMSDIVVQDCTIDNFASATWLRFENHSARQVMWRVGSKGCTWVSRPGTAPRAGEITFPGHFVYFYGFRGPIRNVMVDDVSMDATHLKGGVGVVGNIDGGTIEVGTLQNAGQGIAKAAAPPEGPGAYAVFLYERPSGAPRNLDISIARLTAPYSVGIYSAGARASRFYIGRASGQRDTRDATLFKGILVIQGGRDIDARIDTVEDSNRVVMISIDAGQDLGSAAAAANISVHLGDVRSRPGAQDVIIDAGGSARAGGVRIVGTRSGPAAVGIRVRSSGRTVLSNIDLSGLSSSGAQVPVSLVGRIDRALVALPR